MIPTDDLERAVALITDADSVALACHVGPDGDALGSMLALHHLCRVQGKVSIASFPEPFVVAPHYTFLPGLDTLTKPADFPAAPDVMITFDCGSLDRLGELAIPAQAAGELIVLDHHISNECYGSVNLVDADAAATTVVVRHLAHLLGWPLTRDTALCIYTGLVTDTGRFQYSNTTPAVFSLAEELANFDLPIADMTRQLFEEHRFTYIQLTAACLTRAELDTDLRFVATWITHDDLQQFGVEIEETEGMIDLIRRAAEAEVACILKETPEGIRVSLRSISETDVAAIATGFGGGGHRYAAGFTVGGTVAQVLEDIKAALRATR
jgi:phosphoesterase RecJ-like protein